MALLKKFNGDLIITSDDRLFVSNGETEVREIVLGNADDNKKHKSTVVCLEASKSGKYVAIASENKSIVVYDTNYKVVRRFTTSRSPSKLCFSPTDDLIVADRTGDVYLYDNLEPRLLLGHFSVVLDLTVSNCGRYLITCDRDEKIRVSCYPNAYNIVTYCLGHKEFIISLRLVGDVLISASGDGTVRFWKFIEGTEVNKIDVKDLEEAALDTISSNNLDLDCLPIMTLDVFEGQETFVAFSVCDVNKIYLYNFNPKTFDCTYVRNVTSSQSSFCFYKGNLLFLFENQISTFELPGEVVSEVNSERLKVLSAKISADVKDSDVMMLYKKRFDNVEDYYERKKQRLK